MIIVIFCVLLVIGLGWLYRRQMKRHYETDKLDDMVSEYYKL